MAKGLGIVAILAAAGLAFAQDPQPAQEQGARIDGLVQDLGSADYDARERASEELRRLGQAAVPALERAAQDRDPERRSRAQEILDATRAGGDGRTQEGGRPQERRTPRGNMHVFTTVDTPTYRLVINDQGVRLTDKQTGETFEAPTIEEFRERYPDRSQTLPNFSFGGEDDGQGGGDFGFDFGPLFRDLPQDPNFEMPQFEDMRRQMEEAQRQIEQMLGERLDLDRLFRDFQQFPGGEQPPAEEPPEEARPERGNADREDVGLRLGILDEEARAARDLGEDEGVLVESVEAESRAARAGLREGDIVVAADGRPVNNRWTLRRTISRLLDESGEVPLTVLRGGERLSVTIRGGRLDRDF